MFLNYNAKKRVCQPKKQNSPFRALPPRARFLPSKNRFFYTTYVQKPPQISAPFFVRQTGKKCIFSFGECAPRLFPFSPVLRFLSFSILSEKRPCCKRGKISLKKSSTRSGAFFLYTHSIFFCRIVTDRFFFVTSALLQRYAFLILFFGC